MPIHTQAIFPPFGFTGHETFPFRLGWLHKGVMAVKKDSSIFSQEDAIVRLGVGKNMVRSIRHWCLSLELIDDDKDKGKGNYKTTETGEYLFDVDGADPYLEDVGTLWWLHWRLGRNSKRCTTWHYVLNNLNRPEFSKEALSKELTRAVSDGGGKAPSERTLESDIECFIRTYSAPKRLSFEESLECPLVELNILKEYARSVRLNRGAQDTIPDLIFLAALVEFMQDSTAKTILVEHILHAEGSPGRIFLLDENSCIRRLELLSDLTNGNIVYDATAGMRQILVHSMPSVLEVLQSYYQKERQFHEVP